MSESRDARSKKWVLPIPGVAPIPPEFRVHGDYAATNGFVGPGNSMRVRVDWDGDSSNRGTFEIATSETEWYSCRNLSVEAGINDFIFPARMLTGSSLTVGFARSAAHQARAFKVRAVPILWNGQVPPSVPDDALVVTRDIDYRYNGDSSAVQWVHSQLAGDGVQRVELTLPTGVDYEIWVNLQHPSDDTIWMLQDPILHTGDGRRREAG